MRPHTTHAGFMSTSRNIETPIKYMDRSGSNVLWALQPRLETDEAFHRGADVAILSQFESEKEVLFPPCTLLLVREHPSMTGNHHGVSRESSAKTNEPAHSPDSDMMRSNLFQAAKAQQMGTPNPSLERRSYGSAGFDEDDFPSVEEPASGDRARLSRVGTGIGTSVGHLERVPPGAESYAVSMKRKGVRYIEVHVEPSFI